MRLQKMVISIASCGIVRLIGVIGLYFQRVTGEIVGNAACNFLLVVVPLLTGLSGFNQEYRPATSNFFGTRK